MSDRLPALTVVEPEAPLLSAQSVLDAMNAHVCVVDQDGTVLAVNQAWREFAVANGGDPLSTSVGSNVLAVCGQAGGDEADDAQEFSNGLRRILAGECDHFEMEYPCHSPRSLRWFVASASRLPSPGSCRVLISHQPVTQRRLAQARQREAQKMEALGALAGGMAHDFNNVLAAILGNATLALGDLQPQHPAAAALQRIHSAGERARDVVRRILAFSRGTPQEARPQPLRPLVEEGLAMLRLAVPPGVELLAELGAGVDGRTLDLWVSADGTELQQALMNLVHNAWHALQGAHGTVTVGLERISDSHLPAAGSGAVDLPDDGAGDVAHVWVSDNGCGMSPAVRARIFEPFFTTRAAGQGTGLGLAQVKAAVARAGGRIEVVSEAGRGSQFHLYLPTCAPQTQRKDAALQALPAVAPDKLPAAQLMLVDDDEVVGLTLEFLLRREGYEVSRHCSTTTALESLADPDARVDLLLSDQTMPQMSGWDLCLAARGSRPQLPLLLVSGSIDDELAARVTALGRSAVVAKEDSARSLLPAVRALLSP